MRVIFLFLLASLAAAAPFGVAMNFTSPDGDYFLITAFGRPLPLYDPETFDGVAFINAEPFKGKGEVFFHGVHKPGLYPISLAVHYDDIHRTVSAIGAYDPDTETMEVRMIKMDTTAAISFQDEMKTMSA